MHLDQINSKSPLQLLYIYLAINRTLFVIPCLVKIILTLLSCTWWFEFSLNGKGFFFLVEDVAAEIWIEKDKGHGVQAVNNPPGCSKNCPHTDVLTEKSLVLIPYSTTAHEKKTIQCQFICAEYLKLWETEKNEAAFVLTMGRFNKGCAEALFSSLLSCSGEREPLCCQCPPTATLWLHPVSIAFVLEIVTSIDLGDKFCLVCASLLTWYWKAKFVSHCFFYSSFAHRTIPVYLVGHIQKDHTVSIELVGL